MNDDEIDNRARARVGTVVDGKYTLEGLLGVGGMAAVYRARHRNGTSSAVKILHEELAVVADIRARFLREGYVANQVDHPGAVRVVDDDVAADGAVYLVMELLEGESLEDRIERRGGTLPPVEIVPIVSDLLDVLAAAHERGIVHRDLKPDNIFLCHGGTVKLLDFGVARLRDGTRTMTGAFLGTPQYMAPEQARGDADSSKPAADIWSVGAILFRAIVGRVPHDAENAQLALVAAATQPVPPLASIVPGVDRGVAAVVDRALAAVAGDRYPDAFSMKSALASLPMAVAETDPMYPVLGGEREPSIPTEPTRVSAGNEPIPLPRRRAKRKLPILLVLGVLWLVIVGVGILALKQRLYREQDSAAPGPSASASVAEVPSAAPAPLPSALSSAPPRSSATRELHRGFLTVAAWPNAQVRAGSRVVCAATPCNRVPLAVGRYVLVFSFDEGATMSEPVVIKEGETTSVVKRMSIPESRE